MAEQARWQDVAETEGKAGLWAGQEGSQDIMNGLAEGWAKGRTRVITGDRQDGRQQMRQSR